MTETIVHTELFKAIAQKVYSLRTMSETAKRFNWTDQHLRDCESRTEDSLQHIIRKHLPHGSGFDNGTKIDLERSTESRLVFSTAFHHMDENGFYDGWTEHDVIVTPSLSWGFELRITGRDRREIKDHIADLFRTALGDSCDPYEFERMEREKAAKAS